MDRKTETMIGIVFLAGMVITLVLAIATFEGTPTVILVVTSLVFLGVAMFFLSGQGSASGAGGGIGGGSGDQSQSQSVVITDGQVTRTVQQSSSPVLVVCGGCQARVPESARHCPECGATIQG